MSEMPPEFIPLEEIDDNIISFEPRIDENALDPEQLSDSDIVDAFLAESTHMMGARSPKDVASIVNRLLGGRDQDNANKLQARWYEQTLLRIQESEEIVTEDDLYEDTVVLAIVEKLKATSPHAKDYEEERYALRQLVDIRSVVLANPDMMTKEDEDRWLKLIDKLYHQETNI